MHNILSCQDILKQYGRKHCPLSSLLKIDLRKAYDTLKWDFIKDMLISLNFPSHFIKIVMICICTTQFSLILNGSPMPLFKSKRGIRQGDPMSPLIFVICMEYLSKLLKVVGDHVNFRFHPRCNRLKLNHLCFADDLMIFCRGDLASIRILLAQLEIFCGVLWIGCQLFKISCVSCRYPYFFETVYCGFL